MTIILFITMALFEKVEKLNSKFIWNCMGPRIVKTILIKSKV